MRVHIKDIHSVIIRFFEVVALFFDRDLVNAVCKVFNRVPRKDIIIKLNICELLLGSINIVCRDRLYRQDHDDHE